MQICCCWTIPGLISVCVVGAGVRNNHPWSRAPLPRATHQELLPPTNCLRCWATTRAKTTSRSARQVFIFFPFYVPLQRDADVCYLSLCLCVTFESQSSLTATGRTELKCGALLNVRMSQRYYESPAATRQTDWTASLTWFSSDSSRVWKVTVTALWTVAHPRRRTKLKSCSISNRFISFQAELEVLSWSFILKLNKCL